MSVVAKSIILFLLIILISIAGLILFEWIGLYSFSRNWMPTWLSNASWVGYSESDKDTLDLSDRLFDRQMSSIQLKHQSLKDFEEKLSLREAEIQNREREVERSLEQAEERLRSLEERENAYLDRSKKIEQLAKNFTTMPPEQAVLQMAEMDTFLLVDALRAVDKIAASNSTTSLVSYWISLMNPKRAAKINSLLVTKP